MRLLGQSTGIVSTPGLRGVAPRQRFEKLFREHSRPLLAYALRRADHPEDAADALSEVMLVAWRRLDDVPPGAEARLWLFGVARGVLANQSRSAHRRTRLGQRLRQEVAAAIEADHTEAHDAQEVVRAALRRLPEADREILLLTAWEGLEPTEAATVISITPAAARTRLHRARAHLRRELSALNPTDGSHQGPPTPAGSAVVPRTEEES